MTANIVFLMRSSNTLDNVYVKSHGQEMTVERTVESVIQNVWIINAMVQALENVNFVNQTAAGIFMDTVYVIASGQVLLVVCILVSVIRNVRVAKDHWKRIVSNALIIQLRMNGVRVFVMMDGSAPTVRHIIGSVLQNVTPASGLRRLTAQHVY